MQQLSYCINNLVRGGGGGGGGGCSSFPRKLINMNTLWFIIYFIKVKRII
jgi:hypothetical protein